MRELEVLIDQYGEQILKIAFMYLKDKNSAEDVCQELYIKLVKTKPVFESVEHERAWMIRVTINLCKNHLRSTWVKRVFLGEQQGISHENSVEDIYEARELKRELFENVLALPPQFKDVIILYYYEQYRTAEIAVMLNIAEGTVRSRLDRGRKKLKLLYEEGTTYA